MLVEKLRNMGDGFGGADGLAAVLAVEYGDGQTPTALPGDTPVSPLLNHANHPLLAPGGQPLKTLAGLHSFILEGLHGAEPLGSGPEDDGVLAPPAVGIGVDNLLGSEEHTAFLHIRQNDGVGFVGFQALILTGVVGVPALVVHRHHQIHTVAHTGLVVVSAEAGGGVNTAGTGVHGDILGVHQTGGLGQERMVCQHILKEAAGVGGQHLIILKAANLHHLVHQGLCHDVGLAVFCLHQHIGVPGMEADAHIAGQGPDGGGPDDEEGLGQIKLGQLSQIVCYGELHIHRGAGVVLVLNFCLSQSGLVLGAPVHRLEALVDVALLIHGAENLHFLRLKVLVHGAVGMLPVADDAQPAKTGHLPLDVVFCKLLTGGAELRHRHGLPVQLVLLDDGRLNGHTVVVPAGDIGGVEAHHGMAADDKVLQGLVQGVTHVDVAVGEGRAVVENEGGQILVLFQHLRIKTFLIPPLQHTRLPVGKTGLHGEIGFWGDNGVLIVHGKITSN